MIQSKYIHRRPFWRFLLHFLFTTSLGVLSLIFLFLISAVFLGTRTSTSWEFFLLFASFTLPIASLALFLYLETKVSRNYGLSFQDEEIEFHTRGGIIKTAFEKIDFVIITPLNLIIRIGKNQFLCPIPYFDKANIKKEFVIRNISLRSSFWFPTLAILFFSSTASLLPVGLYHINIPIAVKLVAGFSFFYLGTLWFYKKLSTEPYFQNLQTCMLILCLGLIPLFYAITPKTKSQSIELFVALDTNTNSKKVYKRLSKTCSQLKADDSAKLYKNCATFYNRNRFKKNHSHALHLLDVALQKSQTKEFRNSDVLSTVCHNWNKNNKINAYKFMKKYNIPKKELRHCKSSKSSPAILSSHLR